MMKIYDFDTKPIDYENIENNRLIGEVNISPDLFEVFNIDGENYVLGLVAADKSYGGAHKIDQLNLDADAETHYEHKITCPICGHKDADSWEFEDGEEYNCGMCGAELSVEREVTVEYSASVIKPPTVLEG